MASMSMRPARRERQADDSSKRTSAICRSCRYPAAPLSMGALSLKFLSPARGGEDREDLLRRGETRAGSRPRVGDMQEVGTHQRRHEAEQRETKQPAGEAAGRVLHHPHVPRPEEAAEV